MMEEVLKRRRTIARVYLVQLWSLLQRESKSDKWFIKGNKCSLSTFIEIFPNVQVKSESGLNINIDIESFDTK